MDNETKINRNQAASKDAPNKTRTQTTQMAASKDVPNKNKIQTAASTDVPSTSRSYGAASIDVPPKSKPKIKTAGKNAPRKVASMGLGGRVVDGHMPTPATFPSQLSFSNPMEATGKPPSGTAGTTYSNAPIRTVKLDVANQPASNSVKSKGHDSGPTKAVSLEEVPDKQQPNLTMDLSSLKEAIQHQQEWTTVAARKQRNHPTTHNSTSDARIEPAKSCPQRAAQPPRGAAAGGDGTSAATSASTVTHQEMRRSMRPRPRGRKKAWERALERQTQTQSQQQQQQEQQQKALKRNRPEDSVTPTGEGKKVKTIKPRTRGHLSYAEATALRENHLCVAVMTQPHVELNQTQAEGVRTAIEKMLRAHMISGRGTTTKPKDLRFRGKAHHSEGVLKMWCEDEDTRAWLEQTVEVIDSPIINTQLVLRPQSQIPQRTLCHLFVPGHTEETETTEELIELMSAQNSHLSITNWTLLKTRPKVDPAGTSLLFRVPEQDVEYLRANERRIYYLLGSIYIHIIERGAQQEEMPPPTEHNEQETTNPNEECPISSEARTAPMSVHCASTLMEEEAGPSETEEELMEATEQMTTQASDDECFPDGGGSDDGESCLDSSPLREN